MKYNDFAKEVHANSVKHGWWETGRTFGEVIILCIGEVSEALEEYRDAKPFIYNCCGYCKHDAVCDRDERDKTQCKPEGIAVELADVVIRCFDWFGRKGLDVDCLLDEAKGGERWMNDMPIYVVGGFGDFLAHLSLDLALAYRRHCNAAGDWSAALRMAVCCNEIFAWAEREGVDMDEVMRIKHEYNLTREYKHGGKVM